MISNIDRIKPITLIAGNEFYKLLYNPLVLAVSFILLALAIINAVGGIKTLSYAMVTENPGYDVIVGVGLGQITYSIAFLCTTVAIFIGAVSLVEEHSRKTLGILLTKPLYWRDIVAGKFLGLNAFLLAFISANILISSFLIMGFFRGPISWTEFIVRVSSYIFIVYIACSICSGIAMLIGILTKNILEATLISATFLYLNWYTTFAMNLGKFMLILPGQLMFTILNADGKSQLLNTCIPYMDWLGLAAPFILLAILAVFLIFIIDCFVFIKMDDLYR